MSMKVTQSLRKPHRIKRHKRTPAWEEARARRANKRVGLKPQARDALGFIIYTDKATGETRVKPDSRLAHETILMAKLEKDSNEYRPVAVGKSARKRQIKETDK